MAKILITGVAGFVGSHLADYLIEQNHTVVGLDNFLTGDITNVNPKVEFHEIDIIDAVKLATLMMRVKPDWVFHEAAIARTQWAVDDPRLCNDTNITGTLNMLVAARDAGVKRFIFASSCILYAPNTPYYVSKLAGEEYCKVFAKIYNLPTVCLRYSNAYGSIRQSEKGPSINAIASLRKSKRETGRIWITGDGEQTRDWSHVIDIARANLLAAKSDYVGVLDICTGKSVSMNEVASYFNCGIDYIPERIGDIKHLSASQDPEPAKKAIGYEYKIEFNKDSLKPYLE